MSVSEVKSDPGFDIEHRDPNDLNEHVRVWFDEALAEPDGTHSYHGVWTCSYKTFNALKNCCYIFLTFLCGGPCALVWGLLFACQSCVNIWCFTPCMKSWRMQLNCCASCWRSIVQCCLDPLYESAGLVFSRIKFHHRYEVV